MEETSHFLTVEEVAEKLRLGERTIYRLIERGELKAVKISRKAYRISREDLDNFLIEHKTHE